MIQSSSVISYLLQSGVSLLIMYLFYSFFLRMDRNHMLKRLYLLFSLAAGLTLPLLLPLIRINSESMPVYSVVAEAISINSDRIQSSFSQNIGIYQILLHIYLLGAVLFSMRFFAQIMRFSLLILRNRRQAQKGYTLVRLSNANPFSFFHYIFLDDQSLKNNDKDIIIAHERQHIRQWHSADLLFAEIVLVLQWFNPVIWFYRISLREVHEYLADRAVLSSGHDLNAYRQILIKLNLGNYEAFLGSNFNKSLIFKRIKMMNIAKKSKTAGLKAALSFSSGLIISLLLIMAPEKTLEAQNYGEPDYNYDSLMKVLKTEGKVTIEVNGKHVTYSDPERIKTTQAQTLKNTDKEIFTVVEDMPEFPGGKKAMLNYLMNNIKYPENPRKEKISGTVYVQFLIKKDGSIGKSKVLRGVNKELDAEALRVVKAMPKWEPGKQSGKAVDVIMNIPIKFVLDAEKKEGTNDKTSAPK